MIPKLVTTDEHLVEMFSLVLNNSIPTKILITHACIRHLRLYTTYTARRYANSATKTNGMTESNILDGAYQQEVQNVYSDSIVAISILMIVFMI